MNSRHLLLCVIEIISICFAENYTRNTLTCIWHKNSCLEECPMGLVPVESDCSLKYWPAQRTCMNSDKRLIKTICNFIRCDCPEPFILDTRTDFCHQKEDCPKNRLEILPMKKMTFK